MDNYYEIANRLVPSVYLQQASDARRKRENRLRDFIEHKKWPQKGWDDVTIEQVVMEFSNMDSNNFPGNSGVGEREARIVCNLVARRHFGLGHGIGRSGDICEPQPKAAGSSLMNSLTNHMLRDVIKTMGVPSVDSCLLMPVCTGMTLSLCMSSLRQTRPNGKYVLWSRIDQKSCFKSIITAGFTPIIIDTIEISEGQLSTDLKYLKSLLRKYTAGEVLCVMTTTSCFAPRSADDIVTVAKLCQEFDVPHLINNAYGLQSHSCMHRIQMANKEGRVDMFVQSTDKNLLVPVSGAIVAGFNKDVVSRVAQIYPGRASISPTLDVFMTLLSLGSAKYLSLVKQRKELFVHLKHELSALSVKHNERVLENNNNTISIAMTLENIEVHKCTMIGSMLFMRGVSGARVVENGSSSSLKFICGYEFKNWGAHISSMKNGVPYLTAAASLGGKKEDVDIFIKKLDKIMSKMKGIKTNNTEDSLEISAIENCTSALTMNEPKTKGKGDE